ncbi:lipoprotein 17-related variable surface protein [Mycoplasmopsis pulmonis]|uniref:lipoprotein 17-related variable surface protein n=1 Tax=Mycoplasmopsis pulmonis TaxID=2107 RepID=UPI001CB79994|nr:lipoprotein 17-related variable surface protein [Mycoplasmopsis pulmonis]
MQDVKELEIKESAKDLKNLLPSQITDSTLLTKDNINIKFLTDTDTQLDEKINVSYKLISNEQKQEENSQRNSNQNQNEKFANDDEGTLKVLVEFSYNGVPVTREVKLHGFKNTIQKTQSNNLNLSLSNKEQIHPSELIDSNQQLVTTNFELKSLLETLDIEKYKVLYEKVYVNDIDAEAKIRLTLQLKTNENIKNSFEFVLKDFKKYNLDDSSLKAKINLVKNDLSIEELLNITSKGFGANKTEDDVNKLKETLNIDLPNGYEFEFVSLAPKANDASVGLLTYKLVKNNLDNGTSENPNSKNGRIETNTIVEEITNLSLKKNDSKDEPKKDNSNTNSKDEPKTDEPKVEEPREDEPKTNPMSDSKDKPKIDEPNEKPKDQPKTEPKNEPKDKPKVEPKDETLAIFDKISKIELKENSQLKQKLPSQFKESDLNLSNLKVLVSDDKNKFSELSLPQGYSISFKLASNSNNDEGTLDVKVIVQKQGKEVKTKELKLTNLLTEFESLKESDFQLDFSNKKDRLASSVVMNDKIIKESLVVKNKTIENFDFNKYDISYSVSSLDEVNGKLKIKMTIFKKTKDRLKEFLYEVVGFQLGITNKNILISVRNDKKLSADQIIREFYYLGDNATPEQQLEKLQSLFSVAIPDGLEFEFISFKAKANSNDRGILTYTLRNKKTNARSGKINVEVKTHNIIDSYLAQHVLEVNEIALENDSPFKNKSINELSPNQILENITLFDKNKSIITPEKDIQVKYKIASNPQYNLKQNSINVEVIFEKNGHSQKVTRVLNGFKKFDASWFDVVAKGNILKDNPRDIKQDKTHFKFIANTFGTKSFYFKFQNNQTSKELLKHYNVSVDNIEYKNVAGEIHFDVKFTRKSNSSSETNIVIRKVFSGFKKDLIFTDFEQYDDEDTREHRSIAITTKMPRNQFIQKIVEARQNNDLDALVDYFTNLIAPFRISNETLSFSIRTQNMGSPRKNKGAHREDIADQTAEQFTILHRLSNLVTNKEKNIRDHIREWLNETVFAIRTSHLKTSEEFKNEFLAKKTSSERIELIKKYYDLYIPEGYTLNIYNTHNITSLKYKYDNQVEKENKLSDFEILYIITKGNKSSQRKLILNYGQRIYFNHPKANQLNPLFIKRDFLKYKDEHWKFDLQGALKQIKYRTYNKKVFWIDLDNRRDSWNQTDDNTWTLNISVRNHWYEYRKYFKVHFRYVNGEIHIWGDHPLDGILLAR